MPRTSCRALLAAHFLPRTSCRAPISNRALTLSSLALTLTLLATTAQAGVWTFSCTKTSTGSASYNCYGYGPPQMQTWTPPASSTSLQYGLTGIGFTPQNAGVPSSTTVSAAADISATILLTWTHGTGQTDADDPAPPSVWLYESGSAQWAAQSASGPSYAFVIGSGKASDGIGDAEVANPATGTVTGGLSSSANAPKNLLPPSHWAKYSVVGGVVTLVRTFHAEAKASVGASGGYTVVGATINSYTVTIHAQPYNFLSSGYTKTDGTHANKTSRDKGNAILALSYIWSSTDGNHADLGSCMIKENVTWDSNPQGVGSNGTNPDGQKYYAPPSPPVGLDPATGNPLAYPDPTVTQKPATDPGITDTFSPDAAYTPQYSNVSWWGDQTYVFSDTATGETATPLPGPAAGTFRITRTVAIIPGTTTYGLTISSRDYPAGPMVLPGQ